MNNPAHKPLYNSAAWKHARLAAFERDHYTCRYCGKQTARPTGHHVPPLEELLKRGLDPCDIRYVRTACKACHGKLDGERSHGPKPARKNRFTSWL